MWKLMMTNAAKEWVEAGNFETMTAAAKRIRQIEEYDNPFFFLRVGVYTEDLDDTEALGHLEHEGKKALYVIKRHRPN
jgi:hypothetical protein